MSLFHEIKKRRVDGAIGMNSTPSQKDIDTLVCGNIVTTEEDGNSVSGILIPIPAQDMLWWWGQVDGLPTGQFTTQRKRIVRRRPSVLPFFMLLALLLRKMHSLIGWRWSSSSTGHCLLWNARCTATCANTNQYSVWSIYAWWCLSLGRLLRARLSRCLWMPNAKAMGLCSGFTRN